MTGDHAEGGACQAITQVFALLGKRWTGLIIVTLLDGPARFSRIVQLVPGMSERMLSERLTELSAAGTGHARGGGRPSGQRPLPVDPAGGGVAAGARRARAMGTRATSRDGDGGRTAGRRAMSVGGALVVAVVFEGAVEVGRAVSSRSSPRRLVRCVVDGVLPGSIRSQTGLRGMVNAADHLAATAGIGLLQQGGSAADAAVGAAAVMAVTSPHMCGMGGDLLAMICPPGGEPVALSAIGRAGSGVDADQLRAEGHRVMPLRAGPAHASRFREPSTGGWRCTARWGRLPLATVFAPAIELAEEGFVASVMLMLASHLIHDVAGAQELCPHGPLAPRRARAPAVGGPHPARHRPATGARASTRGSSGRR